MSRRRFLGTSLKVAAAIAAVPLVAESVSASPSNNGYFRTTAALKLRSGPGTTYSVILVMPLLARLSPESDRNRMASPRSRTAAPWAGPPPSTSRSATAAAVTPRSHSAQAGRHRMSTCARRRDRSKCDQGAARAHPGHALQQLLRQLPVDLAPGSVRLGVSRLPDHVAGSGAHLPDDHRPAQPAGASRTRRQKSWQSFHLAPVCGRAINARTATSASPGTASAAGVTPTTWSNHGMQHEALRPRWARGFVALSQSIFPAMSRFSRCDIYAHRRTNPAETSECDCWQPNLRKRYGR